MWRTSPGREKERDSAKAAKEAAKLAAAKKREDAKLAKDEANRAEILAAAKRLGIIS